MSYCTMLGITLRPDAPVWNARAIYTQPGERPDLLPDRQLMDGPDAATKKALADALNAGPLRTFLQSVTDSKLNPAGFALMSVEDRGPGAITIRGTPNSSYGYLYVCACFTADIESITPASAGAFGHSGV
ncbi:hypothetical protein [Candidatus Thiodictyon syntrophicum]|jgi:hypothetical protein|uniref:Uncharacterized protein n=1 Tax=Candidatus Thiodictyon syntrophicum TaxID=1166950 RepID=A0A2K8UHY0_9GAMM|nr:hypothetical protein [Candidatus Thiodictyon syntrophicum]AUB85145.1 hypothetical protein THSYN_29930 [Candidatus Thiodictyon syntrophicum]